MGYITFQQLRFKCRVWKVRRIVERAARRRKEKMRRFNQAKLEAEREYQIDQNNDFNYEKSLEQL